MFLEHFVLRRVVLSQPLNEHGSMLLLLVHIVCQQLLQGGVLGGIYPLLIEIYRLQFLSQGFSGSFQANMLGVKLLQRLKKRRGTLLFLLDYLVSIYSLTIRVPHLGQLTV